jgi:hypothetical protein
VKRFEAEQFASGRRWHAQDWYEHLQVNALTATIADFGLARVFGLPTLQPPKPQAMTPNVVTLW